jgi:mRNA interferase RelE/StbE
MFDILYEKAVKKDIKKINRPDAERIRSAIEQKLCENPQNYSEHLKGELGNYWKLRVGDYRVVYKIEKDVIVILAIMHRSEIYKRILGRFP